MQKVIEALERQLRLEEAAITSNKIQRDTAKQLPGYKGSELYPERPEYIEELKQAIEILKGEEEARHLLIEFWELGVPVSITEINFWEWHMKLKEYFKSINVNKPKVMPDIIIEKLKKELQYAEAEGKRLS